jgi:hypothetical protein
MLHRAHGCKGNNCVAYNTNQNKQDRRVLLETQLTMVHTTKQKTIKLFHIEITVNGMLVCLFDGV